MDSLDAEQEKLFQIFFKILPNFFFKTLKPEKSTFPAFDWPKDKADQSSSEKNRRLIGRYFVLANQKPQLSIPLILRLYRGAPHHSETLGHWLIHIRV